MSRRISLIAATTAAVILIGWYLVLWRPASANLRSSRAAEATARAGQLQLESKLAGLLASERRLPALRSQVRAAAVAVPATASVDTVIDWINAAAVTYGITWSNEAQTLSAAAPTAAATTSTTVASSSASTSAPAATSPTTVAAAPADASATLALTLSVAGTYAHLAEFITDLQHQPRLIVLDTLSYSSGTTGGLAVSIAGRAFYDPASVPATAAAP